MVPDLALVRMIELCRESLRVALPISSIYLSISSGFTSSNSLVIRSLKASCSSTFSIV